MNSIKYFRNIYQSYAKSFRKSKRGKHVATHFMGTDYWKRPWGRGRLKAGGEGDGRGLDVFVASPTGRT